jgi:hypothetical protein
MTLLDPILQIFVMVSGLWDSPVVIVPIALGSAYFGWRIVEYIPFTRRIIERREGGH